MVYRVIFLLMLLLGGLGWAQDDPTPSPVLPAASPTPTPPANYTMTDIPSALEDSRQELAAIVQRLDSGRNVETLDTELASMYRSLQYCPLSGE